MLVLLPLLSGPSRARKPCRSSFLGTGGIGDVFPGIRDPPSCCAMGTLWPLSPESGELIREVYAMGPGQ